MENKPRAYRLFAYIFALTFVGALNFDGSIGTALADSSGSGTLFLRGTIPANVKNEISPSPDNNSNQSSEGSLSTTPSANFTFTTFSPSRSPHSVVAVAYPMAGSTQASRSPASFDTETSPLLIRTMSSSAGAEGESTKLSLPSRFQWTVTVLAP